MNALRDIRVLDLSRLLPGPYLTSILAELGADVIKIESPEGDPTRFTPPFVGDKSAIYEALNHRKRIQTLNLKDAGDVAKFLEQIPHTHVVVESFRPGVLDRLGVGYAQLNALNPRIILCSLTGFGQTGPERHKAGHDLNFLARAGVLALNGPPDASPALAGVQIADIAGGALPAAIAILAALIEQQHTGRGRHIDISMTRHTVSLLAMELARRAAGTQEARGRGVLTGGVPAYGVYQTKDGAYMALAALEPKFFAAFCEHVDALHLKSSGLLQDEAGQRVRAELETIFAQRTQREWVEWLRDVDCCCEPVVTPEVALSDEALGCQYTEWNQIPLLHMFS